MFPLPWIRHLHRLNYHIPPSFLRPSPSLVIPPPPPLSFSHTSPLLSTTAERPERQDTLSQRERREGIQDLRPSSHTPRRPPLREPPDPHRRRRHHHLRPAPHPWLPLGPQQAPPSVPRQDLQMTPLTVPLLPHVPPRPILTQRTPPPLR